MAQSNASIIASLAPTVTRVQVTDEFGHVKFKKVADVCDLDTILFNGKGKPIVMAGKPGRQAKPVMKPANAQVEEMLRAKELAVDEDELLETIKHNPEGNNVLDFVMAGLAEEAASLAFERSEAERKGEGTSQISMRRINALKAVGDSWIKRKEQIANGGVDMDSPAFKRLFQFIMDTFRIALEEDVHARPEMIETIFTALSRRLDDDWTRDAVKKMGEG